MSKNRISTYLHKPYKDLAFTDDFMFRKVLYNNEELCKRVIELLLNVKVDHIVYKGNDHSISAGPDSKSVRLDVYLDDEEGTTFDLEMQNLRRLDLPKRSRFYQSMIDIDHLAAGAEYGELPDSYIIFICMFDPYQTGMHKYEFRELCVQDPGIELGAGTSKVFINALSKEEEMSEDMRAFLDFLCDGRTGSSLTRDLASSVAQAKAFKPWEAEYMQWNEIISLAEQDARKIGREEGREEGRAEGREEGRAEGREEGRTEGREEGRTEAIFESVSKIVAGGICDADRACELLGVSPEEYRKYQTGNE